MNRDLTKTKIMATIGPASNSPEVLEKMIREGLNMCRLNFSHGTHEEHLEVIKNIRAINKKLKTHVAILADLQGPKLRVGEVENNEVELRNGHHLDIVTTECLGTAKKVFLSYTLFPKDVKKGDHLLIDDGKIELQVEKTNETDTVTTRVIYGGVLRSHKGVNLPDTKISQPSLTSKDIRDAEFALDQEVDWIALSFVRHVTDMADLHDIIRRKKKSTRMIAKIEKPEALKEIDEIIDVSHGIMIARGDLGVEVSFDQLPMIQKSIIQKCINSAKPVIIATQMMESMIENFRPTRAEANDVANAVLDGADCLMLSGETSVGKFPVKVISSMRQIIKWTEVHGFHYIREHAPEEFSKSFLPDTICFHTSKMAELSKAKAIVTFTHSGYTALRISSHRPNTEIFAFTNNKKVLKKLSIVWGVRPHFVETYENIDQAIAESIRILKEKGIIKEGEVIIHSGSIPLNLRGQTNMVKISYV